MSRTTDLIARTGADYDVETVARAKLAWWLWEDGNQVIPLDRLGDEQRKWVTYRIDICGLSWLESAWIGGIGTRGEVLDCVRAAGFGKPMTDEEIERFFAVVEHVVAAGKVTSA